MRDDRRAVWSWALYDWGNSAYSTVVIAGFFPIFFKQYWSVGVEATESTYWLGVANSAASLLVALMSPVLGALADQLGRRKGMLFVFACLGVVSTGCLFLVEKGAWELAAVVFVCSLVGFSGANLFYDSLLKVVAGAERVDRISALGYSLGYLGGGLLFAVNVWMTLSPATFGLADAAQAVRISFLCAAGWWAFFSIPILLFVAEEHRASVSTRVAVSASLRELHRTLTHLRSLRQAWTFLLAYWLYIDGVDTIIRMAVDYGLSIGLESTDLITALLITQFVGFPAAIVFGRIGERIGARQGVLIAIGVYICVTVYSVFMQSAWQFYVLAVVIGLVQGGVQALSRSLYARFVPAGRQAEFFGFYNMLGKFAAVLGPVLVGWTALFFDSNRIGILAVLVLLIAGGALLLRVDVAAGEREAQAFR